MLSKSRIRQRTHIMSSCMRSLNLADEVEMQKDYVCANIVSLYFSIAVFLFKLDSPSAIGSTAAFPPLNIVVVLPSSKMGRYVMRILDKVAISRYFWQGGSGEHVTVLKVRKSVESYYDIYSILNMVKRDYRFLLSEGRWSPPWQARWIDVHWTEEYALTSEGCKNVSNWIILLHLKTRNFHFLSWPCALEFSL